MVDKYGQGQRPRIDGNEKCMAAVLLQNSEYFELHNLEITNSGPVHQAGLAGVRVVEEKDFGTAHHIVLHNLFIHDVTGSTSKTGGGSGITTWLGGNKGNTRFDGTSLSKIVI